MEDKSIKIELIPRMESNEVMLGRDEEEMDFVEKSRKEVAVGRAMASLKSMRLKLRMIDEAERKYDKFIAWIEEVAISDPGKAASLYLQQLESIVPKLQREVDGSGNDAANQVLNVFSHEQGEKILRQILEKKTSINEDKQ